MKRSILILGLGAGVMLAAGSAAAGPCTAEIETLEKALAATDAGMGPTGGVTGGAVGGATDGAVGAAPEAQHPPTETMNQAAEGKATSPEDVLQQNQGAPTDADAAQAGQTTTAAGVDEASDALRRAKELDKAGDEAACMSEIGRVKGALQIE